MDIVSSAKLTSLTVIPLSEPLPFTIFKFWSKVILLIEL